MLRRLHPDQPESFAFTPENREWAEAQISKYPPGRQASAIIPLLWRAQEQEGWLTRKAIEHVCDMLGMAHIRGLEVATFYFMFQLQPVGSVAHIQVCGTTSCMICGAEDLIGTCREKIAPRAHMLSDDGKFSWEEVECLGACANAPMAQIGKDYYEDLTAERLGEIIDELAAGRVPVPGPQNGRFASEPLGGPTSLTAHLEGRPEHNASVELATRLGDTVKRIDGTEVPLRTPWTHRPDSAQGVTPAEQPMPAADTPPDASGVTKEEATELSRAKPVGKRFPAVGEEEQAVPPSTTAPGSAELSADKGMVRSEEETATVRTPRPEDRPEGLPAPRGEGADNLKLIRGIGPKIEAMLNEMGIFHFEQIASWRAQQIAWVDENLKGFPGRATRDDWVAQARTLASGEDTEFSKDAKNEGIHKG